MYVLGFMIKCTICHLQYRICLCYKLYYIVFSVSILCALFVLRQFGFRMYIILYCIDFVYIVCIASIFIRMYIVSLIRRFYVYASILCTLFYCIDFVYIVCNVSILWQAILYYIEFVLYIYAQGGRSSSSYLTNMKLFFSSRSYMAGW